ncbi:MAG: polysaccharide biosynthesis protein [Lachnospiraceae bacterium]|nr:polysaccharide biosynthesis protein [Lachnospiraceae bacterium]
MKGYQSIKKWKEIRVGFLQIPITRIMLLVFCDLFAVFLSSILPLYVRYDFQFMEIDKAFLYAVLEAYICNAILMLVMFRLFRLYNSVWRYASETELVNNAFAVLICAAIQPILFMILGERVPYSFPFFYGFFLLLFTIATRFGYRILRVLQNRRMDVFGKEKRLTCMIVGAGAAGNAIMKEIESSHYLKMHVACAIDDNLGCQGKYLRGVPIVGGRERIVECAKQYDIDEIIIAIPSASRSTLQPILEICKETHCRLRILPGMYQIINGEVNVTKLREVQIEDLLGRDPIQVNVDEIMDYVSGKTVLVTGAGGSIGSELCRQISSHTPKQLILVDIYENNLYEIQQELLSDFPQQNIVTLIASVRNTKRIDEIFRTYRPHIVYHAAAHKHVPLMEDSPNEAVKNNVFGTYKCAMAAHKYKAERFVLISTDKAVNPTNVMGATKRICEMIIQDMNRKSQTIFVAVRFGNVLGSNGSVIPLFKKQIESGGPVTVTHPDIIRYFMTIPEAVSLVLQAGAYAQKGEIFVLDMGKPMKILDLATTLIQLSGYRVNEDIKIEYIGLRPGEKMYEELLMKEEGLKETPNELIFIDKPPEFHHETFANQLEVLKKVSVEESEQIRAVLQEIVSTYHYERTR